MTTIIGIQEDGVAWIGGDGLTGGNDIATCSIAEPKIFQVKDMLIGVAGYLSVCQTLRYLLTLEPRRIDQSSDDFMVTSFLPAVRACFDNAKLTGTEIVSTSELLVLFDGAIFQVTFGDWSVAKIATQFFAIGSGSQYALGSLYATKPGPSAEQRIRSGLDAAEEFDAGTGKSRSVMSMVQPYKAPSGHNESQPTRPSNLRDQAGTQPFTQLIKGAYRTPRRFGPRK